MTPMVLIFIIFFGCMHTLTSFCILYIMKSLIVTEEFQNKQLLLPNLLIAGLREISGDTDKMGYGQFFF